MVTVVSYAPYFYHAYLIIPNDEVKKKVTSLLSKHLMYMEKAPRNFTDKVIEFLSKLIPDDEEVVQKQMQASL